MQVSLAELPNWRRTLAVQVPEVRVQEERERVIGRLQRKARIPGFRHGRIPKEMIRTRYREAIEQEVVEALIPKAYREALDAKGLTPISRPTFSKVQVGDSGLAFEAHFDVKPEIRLGRYTNFKVEVTVPPVREVEVKEALAALQERAVQFAPVDRVACDKDLVLFDYTPLDARGTPLERQRVKGAQMILASGELLPGFEEGIRGLRAGQERRIVVTYPADHHATELRGLTREFLVRVNEVKEKHLPPIDDAFARSLGPFEGLEALRRKIQGDLGEERQRVARRTVEEKVVDQAIEANPFEAPGSLVEEFLDGLLVDLRGRTQAAGGPPPDDAKAREIYRPLAIREVKRALILEAIGAREGIAASDHDVEEEVQQMARRAGKPVEFVRNQVSTKPEAAARLRREITTRKVLQHLADHSEARVVHGS